jgi:CheY-like chemotaxis protein
MRDRAAVPATGPTRREASMRILIADDHTLFRRGLALVLSRLYPGVEVVEAGDADGAVKAVEADARFDLVLCDLAMPGMDQLRGLQALRERLPDVRSSSYPRSRTSRYRACHRMRARGYVLKSVGDETLKHALSLMLSGETYLPSDAFLDRERHWVGGRPDDDFPIIHERPHRPTARGADAADGRALIRRSRRLGPGHHQGASRSSSASSRRTDPGNKG